MELIEIKSIPNRAEDTKHITIQVMNKECFIWIWSSQFKYYIELSGWYTGKSLWSTSRNQSLKDVITEVSKIAMERTFKAFERDGLL